MGLNGVRKGAGKQDKKDGIKNKEPLVDRSRFTYSVTQKQLKLFIKIKAKRELRKIAETGKDEDRRVEAVNGLAEIEDKESIPILEEIAGTDPEEEVRDEAGKAILKLRGEEKEFSEHGGIEELNIAEIVGDDADFIEPLTEDDFPDFEIEDPEAEELLQERQSMSRINAFVDGNDGELHFIIEMATIDGNETLRRKAMFALVESDDHEALNNIQLILNSMKDEELSNDELKEKREIQRKLDVKKAAITAKEFLRGDESKLSEVAKMLFDEKDIDTRKIAFETLLITKNPQGLETLKLYLADEGADEGELNFKRYLLKEMDGLRDPRFVDIFMEVLRFSTDYGIIDMCIASLFMYGNKKAIEVLEYTANRDDLDKERKRDAAMAVNLMMTIK